MSVSPQRGQPTWSYVVAHHPESGPEAVGGLGQANRRLDLAVGERPLAEGVDASRGKAAVYIVFAACRQNEASVAAAVVADADVDRAFRIILQLIVGSVVVPFLDIPAIGVEACGVEKVFPHQSIAGHSRRTRLWRRCPGAEGAEGQHCREYYCFHCSGGEIRISLLRLWFRGAQYRFVRARGWPRGVPEGRNIRRERRHRCRSLPQ